MTVAEPHVPEPEPVSLRTGLDSLMIEIAGLAHLPYLHRLKQQVMEKRYRPASSEDEFERWRETYCSEEYFRGLVEDPDATLLSLGSLREPVGMVVMRRHEDHLEIDDLLCLTPRKGDGTRLITACLSYAEIWRINDVRIDVYPGHTSAERFLERHGFRRVEDVTNDLGRPMHRFGRSVAGPARWQ